LKISVSRKELLASCQLRGEFYRGGYEDRILVRDAEESPLLEAVAREWLIKTDEDIADWKRAGGGRCCGDL
jgi:hypothetical protein